MPRRILFLTLAMCVVICAVVLSSARARGVQSAGSSNSNVGAAGNQPPRVALKAEPNTPAPVAVSEIDEVGLAKILRRDAAEATAAARPLLINFWATWCDPCREEFPDLVKIDETYRQRGLDFALVSLDDVAEIKTSVPQFIEKMRAARIPAYLLNVKDPETAIAAVDKEWRGDLPATFLFDARGQIVFKHMGRIKPKELRAAIDKTLNASAPSAQQTQ
jgi:thiol-disulfide isomerase/thioredoxin